MWVENSHIKVRALKPSAPEPIAAMSSLAPSSTLPMSCSPLMGWRSGSIRTSLQTSESRLAVMSRISLRLIEGNPPLEHDKAWSTEKFLPQAQVVGVREGCQL